MAYLRVEVSTSQCEEGTAYVHKLPLTANKVDILDAIETLYGNEEVISILIQADEDDG